MSVFGGFLSFREVKDNFTMACNHTINKYRSSIDVIKHGGLLMHADCLKHVCASMSITLL